MTHLCSFSGPAAEIPARQRSRGNVLLAIVDAPRVSTWDLSEKAWLRNHLNDLVSDGMLIQVQEPFPWIRYEPTESGEREVERLRDDDNA